MNAILEEGLKVWLAAEGVVEPIFTGLTSDKQPVDDQTITVFVRDTPRTVGALYRANCSFTIATPSRDESTPEEALAHHKTTCETVRALLEGFAATTLKASLEASTSLFFRGGFLKSGGSSGVDGGKWITTIEFVAGISTADI